MPRLLITGADGFIGSHALSAAETCGAFDSVIGIDIDVRRPSTLQCDIRDPSVLNRVFKDFKPTHVLNLAGDTDLSIPTTFGYSTNIIGTNCVIEACNSTITVERLLHISTQHVCRLESGPIDDHHFVPDTRYAESKAISELLLRSGSKKPWSIGRPTNIWGPGHKLLADGFWRILSQRRYVHPAADEVVRGYGFVSNSVDQMLAILLSPAAVGRVLYITDPPIKQTEWVDAFAKKLTGRRARRVPQGFLRAAAVVGEAGRRFGLRSPLYLSRYQSMMSTQLVPYSDTLSIAGEPRVSLAEGVEATVQWLQGRLSQE